MDHATHIIVDEECRLAVAELKMLHANWKAKHVHVLQPLTYGDGNGLPALVSSHYNGQVFPHINLFVTLLNMPTDPEPGHFADWIDLEG